MALVKIIFHAASNPSNEVAGLLIGKHHGNDTLRIEDAAGREQPGTSVSIALTPEFQAIIRS